MKYHRTREISDDENMKYHRLGRQHVENVKYHRLAGWLAGWLAGYGKRLWEKALPEKQRISQRRGGVCVGAMPRNLLAKVWIGRERMAYFRFGMAYFRCAQRKIHTGRGGGRLVRGGPAAPRTPLQ